MKFYHTQANLRDKTFWLFQCRKFLSSYRKLLIATAHARGAPATGGRSVQTHSDRSVTELQYTKLVMKM